MPERIQLRRTPGWRKPAGAVVVSRPSRWGNPYRVVQASYDRMLGEYLWTVTAPPGLPPFFAGEYSRTEAAALAVKLYRRGITGSQARIEDLTPLLRGKDLCCWCRTDQPCHADVLLELANRGTESGAA